MKRRTLIILSTIVVAAIAVLSLTPLRRPPAVIAASLLLSTPLGSSKEEVQAIFAKKGWEARVRSTGFLKQELGRRYEVVGVSSIDSHLGEYGFLFRTSVVAFWGFDAKGKLIDVWVWKTTDGF